MGRIVWQSYSLNLFSTDRRSFYVRRSATSARMSVWASQRVFDYVTYQCHTAWVMAWSEEWYRGLYLGHHTLGEPCGNLLERHLMRRLPVGSNSVLQFADSLSSHQSLTGLKSSLSESISCSVENPVSEYLCASSRSSLLSSKPLTDGYRLQTQGRTES